MTTRDAVDAFRRGVELSDELYARQTARVLALDPRRPPEPVNLELGLEQDRELEPSSASTRPRARAEQTSSSGSS